MFNFCFTLQEKTQKGGGSTQDKSKNEGGELWQKYNDSKCAPVLSPVLSSVLSSGYMQGLFGKSDIDMFYVCR